MNTQHKHINDSEEKYFKIRSIEKGIRVLELLAEKEKLSVTQVARHLGFNRTGSHRYLATLRELGYVDKDSASQYYLTFRILDLGMKIANRFEIRKIARPYMEKLASMFNETINLGYWDGKVIINIDKLDSSNVLRTISTIGTLMPAHCTSLGKSILAFLPESELNTYLDSATFDLYMPNTITTKESLLKELEQTRKRGFAIDNEEWIMGIRCIAAPIYDQAGHPSYALSVAGPEMRMTPEMVNRIQKKVKEACNEITAIFRKTGRTP
jgi:DNA-binding IclR family transcriptional regulator